MEVRSVFVVGLKSREGLQAYGGPVTREDEALACYCTPGAFIVYFDRPDSPGMDAWRAVNHRWERCPGWTVDHQMRRAPSRDLVDEFNREMQALEAERDARRKGTRSHLSQCR